jgi:hypothetical protein
VKKIEQRTGGMLQIEAPTLYTFIPTETELVFLVVYRAFAEELRPLLAEVKDRAQGQ